MLSAVFSTVSVLSVLLLIMTETGIWDGLSNEACGRFLEVISEVNSRSILGQFSVNQALNSVKQALNSVKHGQNSHETQSNGRAKPPRLK